MVCKEDLCLWFKNLSPRNRIEYMCALLNMCLPFELRFMGTVLEHYGKKDYHYLRNDEVAANKQSEILKYRNITKPEALRSKVTVTLALMRSSSTACAQIIYELIENNLTTVFSFGPGTDSREADEILTALTLAANHPALMFQQKLHLSAHLRMLTTQREKLDEEVPLNLYPDNHLSHYPAQEASMPVHHAALCNRHSPVSQSRKVFVHHIEVRAPKKAAEKKAGPEYLIVASWSNGEETEVGKRFREIQDFHRQMIDMFPDEKPPNGRLPGLPAGSPHQHSSREEHIKEQIHTLNNYFRNLTSVPSHILESEHVCQFFKGVVIRPAHPLSVVTPTHPYHPPDEEEVVNAVPMQMKSMSLRNPHLYYLSPQLSDAAGRLQRFFPAHPMYFVPPRFPTSHACQTLLMPSPQMPAAMHQHQHQHPQQQPPLQHPPPPPQQLSQSQQQQQQQQQQPSPVSPSSRSELSSTTTSPTCSRSASPSTDPGSSSSALSVAQLLKLLGLEKYTVALGGLDLQQLSGMSCEELSKQGLPREAQHILRSKLDQINSEKPVLMNGLVDNLVYPPFSLPSPSPTYQWLPSTYAHFHRAPPMPPASPRSGVSLMDSSMSDVASGGGASPPVSPGPAKLQGLMMAGKGAAADDSSEGSEDLGREKGEGLIPEGAKSLSHHQHQPGKTAQVKVSPGSGGGKGVPAAPAPYRQTPG